MENSNYKEFAIKAAKELCYGDAVISRLYAATTEIEITRILKTAREAE